MSQGLPSKVVTEDKRLSKASAELAKLRWHWTLDESNPDRVSFREYGRQVGIHPKQISSGAKGYIAYTERVPRDALRSLSDEIKMAGIGDTRQLAAEAIADAEGTTVGNIISNHYSEIKKVIEEATDTAERRGTTIEDEIPGKAEWAATSKAAETAQDERKKASQSASFASLESKLTRAWTLLKGAAEDAEYAGMSDDELADLVALVQKTRSALEMIDLKLTGTTGVDWDGEAATLGSA